MVCRRQRDSEHAHMHNMIILDIDIVGKLGVKRKGMRFNEPDSGDEESPRHKLSSCKGIDSCLECLPLSGGV